jgi:BirA family biotin operon repressor/biotin-[acetyl-CoA-carboxylase] ligase
MFLAHATRDEAHGAIFTTLEQTAGRGTRGRSWWAPPDAALPLSLVLAPVTAYPHPAAVTLVAALALCDAAIEFGACTRIRWPNDLVDRDGRKLAGILAEAINDRFPALIVGIGINARPSRHTPPADLAQPYSDLVSAGATDRGRVAFTRSLCVTLERRLSEFEHDGVAAVAAGFNERSALAGRRVELRHGSRPIRGRFEGMDSAFRVVLALESGGTVALPAEQLELLRHE